ncbi:MAG: NAD(P)/FAD-dependent oxidoreductase [Alphaproteobacteria bacterium]|nr:NAD(P)/FAD-dependent oxidoreductase [Alphaproteobacteria bacterium]
MKNKKPKIIVIGAGLSGLTAGYRLHQNNFDVQLFEARNRVDGRVQTVLIKNLEGNYSYAELGGQNFSDAEDPKHILGLAKELDLDEVISHIPFTRLFYDGKDYHDVDVLFKKYFTDIDALEKKLHSIKNTNPSLENYIKTYAQGNSILERVLFFFLKSYEGSSINLLSVEHNLETLLFFIKRGLPVSGQDNNNGEDVKFVSLKKGNAQILTKIAEILDDKIYLNKELISVKLSTEGQFFLHFKDKTIECCDKLILTMPASVYKNINFEEGLIPQSQLNDICKVQYGQHSKILMPMRHHDLKHSFVFSDDMIGFFGQDQKLLNMYFTNIDQVKPLLNEKFAKDLKILQNGYQTALFSKTSPEIASDENYGFYNAPVYKSWSEDPFSLGSYSNFGIQLGKKFGEIESIEGIKVKTIFKPVNNCIFFAGEHTTIIDAIGTMEAAVESGDRIAALIDRL